VALLVVSVAAGCVTPTTDPGASTGPGATATSGFSATGAPILASFPTGIYYVDPTHDQPGDPRVRLVHIPEALARSVRVYPNMYDLGRDRVISSDSQSTLRIEAANGTVHHVKLDGLYAMGRPTSSPDGLHVAVQALDDPNIHPAYGVAAPYAVHVADLRDGSHRRVSPSDEKCESPKWIPGSPDLLFSCFQPDGPDMPKLYRVNATTGAQVKMLGHLGTLMPGVSKDGQHFLQPDILRVWNLTTGALLHDLKEAAVAGMRAAGYDLDSAHAGAGNRGSFPLDGDFSPDGKSLVFDGAVTKDGHEGILVMRIDVDGTGFEVLSGMVAADPQATNNYNYSPLNPRWLA
jgi:hypothetical protein